MIFAVDGGFQGGLSLIEDDGKMVYSIPMPVVKGGKGTRTQYDIQRITNLIIDANQKDPNLFAILEHSQVSPIAGKNSCFQMGFYLGLFQGILEAVKVSYQVVKARKWQSEILTGMPGKDTKARSILWCQRKYPNFDWRTTPRCQKANDGMTDSMCMCHYGRKIK